MRNNYQQLAIATGKRPRVLGIFMVLSLLVLVLMPGMQARAQTNSPSNTLSAGVSLNLSSMQIISLPNSTRKGITVKALLQNSTFYAITYRSGCIGPLVHLTNAANLKFKLKFYPGHAQTNANSCIPTMVNVPANGQETLTDTYVLQDAATLQAISDGAYQAEEELTYTIIKGNPAKRYKKLSDNSLVDTFHSTIVHSNTQSLQINSMALLHPTIHPAGASVIQSASGNSGKANPTIAFSSYVQANNLLLAAISCWSTTSGIPHDSLGNSWKSSNSIRFGPNNAYTLGMYYAVSTRTGSAAITFSCNGVSSFAITEVFGLTTAPLDQVGNATGTSAEPNVVTSAPTTQLSDLVVGFVGDNGTMAHSYSETQAGYANIQHSSSQYGNFDLVYSSTDTSGYHATSWNSSSNVAWGALQATFKVAPTPPASPQNSQIGPFHPKVLIIDYNTSGKADDGSSTLTQELLKAYATASNYHGTSLSSAQFQVYHAYTQYNPPPILPGTTHGNTTGDYQAVFNDYNICNLAATEGVNFVWIWASGSEQGSIFYAGDFNEWVTTGPTFYQTYGANVPFCGSNTVTVFGFNYSRSVASALHSSGHYMENVLQFAFGPSTDLSNGTPGGTNMYDLFDGQVSRYGGYNGPLNTATAQCGDVHFPPNTTQAYDYGNSTVVTSDCASYNPGDPSAQRFVPVSAATWEAIPCDASLQSNTGDCQQESYLLWWMQNMPGYSNKILDQTDNLMPNWWQYILALDTTVRYN
ncbi:MAG: hypothetical protein ACYDER_05850 [Ktedonobacteraceae bacterium]